MNKFYVYQLMDPRTNLPFYVGKGKNNRAWEHTKEAFDAHNPYKSRKIQSIRNDGYEPNVEIVFNNLSEEQSFILETELIKKYGRFGLDENGILTNLTLGGRGGTTSHCLTPNGRERIQKRHQGVNNPRSRLTIEQVIEIYRSTESKEILTRIYNISNGIINGIKGKRYYRSITDTLDELAGKCKGDKKIPLSKEVIEDIYYFEGTVKELKEQFGVSVTLARNIKTGHTYKNITKNLGNPGGIKLHGLTWNDVVEIRKSSESNKILSNYYGVSPNTISSIRNMKTRLYR